MTEVKQFSTKINGKDLTVETGKLALHTNASCTVRYGDTVILATAVMSPNTRENIDYFPLMVDYEEKMYATGKIKGSRFIKREGRPTEKAIIAARVIDRGLRPLFPEELRNDVQVVLTVLSVDEEHDPSILAITAASIVLHISDIPWNGPLAGVRVGQVEGKLVFDPTYPELEKSNMDLVISVTKDSKVAMFEARGDEVPDETFYQATEFGVKEGQQIIAFIED